MATLLLLQLRVSLQLLSLMLPLLVLPLLSLPLLLLPLLSLSPRFYCCRCMLRAAPAPLTGRGARTTPTRSTLRHDMA